MARRPRKGAATEEKALYADLAEAFLAVTEGRTLEEQRRSLLEEFRSGEKSRWDVAVELMQSLLVREIDWWIKESDLQASPDDRRQLAEIFYALGRVMKWIPANGEALRRLAGETEN